MSGRTFGASLKPAWSEQQIQDFLNRTKGDIKAFIINHDKDFNEDTGDIVEEHTHIYLEYTNPRKVSTVANLLEVEPNFIEIIRNKKGYLRYLTHMDQNDKHRYGADEVYTNSSQSYEITVLGNAMSDKDIAEYIIQGRGVELLGVVSASKLRTIQSFLHFDNSNHMLEEIRMLNNKVQYVLDIAEKVETMANGFVNALDLTVNDLVGGMRLIANEISKVTLLVGSKREDSNNFSNQL